MVWPLVDLKAYCPEMHLTPLISTLDYWCEEKSINPTSPDYKRIMTLFNRSGS